MSLAIGPDCVLAQLAATIAFADTGSGASTIHLYTDAAAADGSAPAGSPIASIALAKPCGSIADGQLTLHPADAAGALVLASATPRAAQWISADGLLVAAGTVTDTEHAGDFRIGGAATASGDDSPQLYAGGLVLLGAVVLD